MDKRDETKKKMHKERSNLFMEQLGWRFSMVIKLLFNDKKKKRSNY